MLINIQKICSFKSQISLQPHNILIRVFIARFLTSMQDQDVACKVHIIECRREKISVQGFRACNGNYRDWLNIKVWHVTIIYFPDSKNIRHWSDCADAHACLGRCCTYMYTT